MLLLFTHKTISQTCLRFFSYVFEIRWKCQAKVIADRVTAVQQFKLFRFKQNLQEAGKPEVFRNIVKDTLRIKIETERKRLQDEAIAQAVAAATSEAPREASGLLSRVFG